MDTLNFSLILLLFSPALILALHIVTSRTARYFKRQVPAQKLALVCIILGNVPMGLLVWFLVLRNLGLAGQFWGAAYCILVYNAIGHVYFHLFNMTETSIRVRLLREIAVQEQTIDEVIDRYNPSNSVGVRLERLQDIGVVEQTGGRYFLQSQWLYYVGIVCRAWGYLLGFNEKDNGYIVLAKGKSNHNNYSISASKRNIAIPSSFGIAVIILLAIVAVTHMLPTAMGLSFWPLPFGPYTYTRPMDRLIMPANLSGVDNFSFPHVDWPWRKVARHFLELGELPLWNPYSSLGLPFAPQYENQLFFPLEWIEIFGGPHS